MPYVVQRALTYRGRDLKPGDPLGDDHPKRSLITTKKVQWIKSTPDEIRPDAPLTTDRAVDRHPLLAASPPPPSEKPVVMVPSIDEVMAAGYSREAAEKVVERQENLAYLIGEGMEPSDALALVDDLPEKGAPPVVEPGLDPVVEITEQTAPAERLPAALESGDVQTLPNPIAPAGEPVIDVVIAEEPAPELMIEAEPVVDVDPPVPVQPAIIKKGKRWGKPRKG